MSGLAESAGMQTKASTPPASAYLRALPLRRIELDRVDALNDLLKNLALWKQQRPELAADIHTTSVCLLSHPFTDGRLDLTVLSSNRALPTMPLPVWQSLRQFFSSHDLQGLTVILPASCCADWSAGHHAAVMNALAPLHELTVNAPVAEPAAGKKSRRVWAPA